jgi:hypothetical protein
LSPDDVAKLVAEAEAETNDDPNVRARIEATYELQCFIGMGYQAVQAETHARRIPFVEQET